MFREWQLARLQSMISGDGGYALASWLEEQRKSSHAHISEIPLSSLERWDYDRKSGYLLLRHDTGRFFSVEGRRIKFDSGRQWDQAVLHQPERGLLGMAARIRSGNLEILLQAKMEPGCINLVQASPTIQATRSNYTRVHQGKMPEYFNLFTSVDETFLVRSPQVEQTTRFLDKKNYNVFRILPSNEQLPSTGNFRWCTLRDIKELYLMDNGINMNTRSILACLPPIIPHNIPAKEELLPKNPEIAELLTRLYASLNRDSMAALQQVGETMVWLEQVSEHGTVTIHERSLDEMEDWTMDDWSIRSPYFSIVGMRVQADREVATWDQPLVAQPENGISALVGKTIHGVPHFLFQAKSDMGGNPPMHLAPTVSSSVPSLRTGTDNTPPFLQEILDRPPESFVFNAILSEEGGRFQKCQNSYRILWDEDFPITPIPDNFRWIPYETVFELVRHGYLNIEARSIFGLLT